MSTGYGRMRKRVKVTHRMTPYDVMVRSVIINDNKSAVSKDEDKNILEGEVLMENDTQRSLYLSSHRHVHSNQDAFGDISEYAKLCNDLRYAGIAVTGFDAANGVYQQGFMSTIGGLNTLMNTGDSALVAGKEVFVVPVPNNDKRPYFSGISRTKKLFATVHEDTTPTSLWSQCATELANGGSDAEKQNAMRKFCIGTVLRGGRKGQLVDVVLHSSASVIIQG